MKFYFARIQDCFDRRQTAVLPLAALCELFLRRIPDSGTLSSTSIISKRSLSKNSPVPADAGISYSGSSRSTRRSRTLVCDILHVDCNAFYASVEAQRHPELRDKPPVVCGSVEERHGIVLTANYIAKPRGVKTGMAIWQAKQYCPESVTLEPDMPEYIRFSRMAREIYEDYTDQIEPFGLDESWLDVTGSVGGVGERYTCLIHGQESYLWLEKGRWFVAAKRTD